MGLFNDAECIRTKVHILDAPACPHKIISPDKVVVVKAIWKVAKPTENTKSNFN